MYVRRAVQFHPSGGQFGFARSPARTPRGVYVYVSMGWQNQEKTPTGKGFVTVCLGCVARPRVRVVAGRVPGKAPWPQTGLPPTHFSVLPWITCKKGLPTTDGVNMMSTANRVAGSPFLDATLGHIMKKGYSTTGGANIMLTASRCAAMVRRWVGSSSGLAPPVQCRPSARLGPGQLAAMVRRWVGSSSSLAPLVQRRPSARLDPPPRHGAQVAVGYRLDLSHPGTALEVRLASRSIPPQWGSIRFRLAPRTYAPWGCVVHVVSQPKSRRYPP